MSTPNPNDPGYVTPVTGEPSYNRVDPDAPVVEPPRRGNGLLWLLLLLVLIALGWWWYGKQNVAPAPTEPVTTDQPAAIEQATDATGTAATTPKATTPKPAAKPKTPAVAKVTRDPSPLTSNAAPKYPPQALRAGVEGSVSVRIEVDASGVPTDVQVVDRSGERSRDLDRAVVDAVRKWRFEPAMQDGKAVAGAVVLPVEFKNQ